MLLRDIQGTPVGVSVDSTIKRIVINEMETTAPILKYAQFYTFQGNSDNIAPEANANVGDFRAINSEPATVNTDYGTPLNVPLKILSARVRTDRAYQDRGLDLEGEHLRQVRAAARNLGRKFMNYLINGNGGNAITGLRNDNQVQVVTFDTADGGELSVGIETSARKQQAKFLETLDNVILSVPNGANCLIMNAALASRLSTIFREYVNYNSIIAATGDVLQIPSYKGIPIVISGINADGNEIIGNDYVLGTNNTTALYALRFEERDMVTFATTKSGITTIFNPNNSAFVSTDIELQYNLVVVNPKAAVKLKGIILSLPATANT